MQLTDHELRALVRDSIARASAHSVEPDPRASFQTHASHFRLAVLRGGDDDGACIIEPAVRCTHCGYCQSFGH
jgi:hypothetical protein